ncbi:hypothetical protein [Raineya sp.]|jgi:hypothetical protein
MKKGIFFSLFLSFLAIFASGQEFQSDEWNIGISNGIGGANLFLLPALDIVYQKNTFSFAPSRNTWGVAYIRELKKFGSKQNFEWIFTAAFAAEFRPSIEEPIQNIKISDYYAKPKQKNGRYIYMVFSGIRTNFLKHLAISAQIGFAAIDETYRTPTRLLVLQPSAQIGLGLYLFKRY